MKSLTSDKKSKISLVIILIAILIFINPLFITTQKQLFFPTKILVQQILILIILISFLLYKHIERIKISQQLIILGLYILYLFIRTIIQPVPSYGFEQLVYLIPYFLLYAILSQLNLNKNEMLFISNTFLLSFIVSIVFGIFLQSKHSSFSNFSRLQLTWANANYLASYLLVTLAFVLYSWKTSKEKWIHVISATSIAIVLIFLLWTQSRGGLVSFFLILICIFLFYAIKNKKKWLIAGLSVIIIIFIIGSIYVFRTIRPQTLIFRERIYQADVHYIKHNFVFGSGVGTFVREFPQYRLKDYKLYGQEDIISHAHNEFIEVWAETGIVGIALILLFFLSLIKNFKNNINSKNKYFLYAAGFSLLLLLIHNLFSITMRIPPILFYFFVLTGFLAQNYNKENGSKVRFVSKFILIVFVVVLIICIYQQLRTIQGLKHFSRSEELYAQKDPNLMMSAILEAEKASKYIPENADLLYHKGFLYSMQQDDVNALKTYQKLEKVAPYYPQLFFWKGYILSLKGDWIASVKSYKREIEYNEYPKVYFNLAIAYHYLGDENKSMLNFLHFAEKIKLKIEKHLIKDKQQILEEEGWNLKFALDKLEEYYKKNVALSNRIKELKGCFFPEGNN
ncbi:MAG: O-antigen ligase family protein [Candidatus Cloacimonetes bacterium]|nr:O-antigen ligase family protein [Candidatus Cloacimonadota bacterium]